MNGTEPPSQEPAQFNTIAEVGAASKCVNVSSGSSNSLGAWGEILGYGYLCLPHMLVDLRRFNGINVLS